MSRNQLLKSANIPESWWADCYIDGNDMIFTPRFSENNVMIATGTEVYQELINQPPITPALSISDQVDTLQNSLLAAQQAIEGINQKIGLSQNKTIYVAESGSDATGDGSQSKPFRSIQKALDTVPKALNGYAVTISLSAGSYEGFSSIGFLNGGISITGINAKNSVKIISPCRHTSRAHLLLMYLTFTGSFSNSAFLVNEICVSHIRNCWFSNIVLPNNISLIYALQGAILSVVYVECENCKASIIFLSSGGAETLLHTISGTGNTGIGLYVNAGTIRKLLVTMQATTEKLVYAGGEIVG